MSCYHNTGLRSDCTLRAWPSTSRSAVKAHSSARHSLARTAQSCPWDIMRLAAAQHVFPDIGHQPAICWEGLETSTQSELVRKERDLTVIEPLTNFTPVVTRSSKRTNDFALDL